MRGDMHGSIRKTYVKHKTYRKLNICKTSVFPDVAKSWCSKLYGLCAQRLALHCAFAVDFDPSAVRLWTAPQRRRNVVSTSPRVGEGER